MTKLALASDNMLYAIGEDAVCRVYDLELEAANELVYEYKGHASGDQDSNRTLLGITPLPDGRVMTSDSEVYIYIYTYINAHQTYPIPCVDDSFVSLHVMFHDVYGSGRYSHLGPKT